eukprot:2054631-Rhodomonas_salina.1
MQRPSSAASWSGLCVSSTRAPRNQTPPSSFSAQFLARWVACIVSEASPVYTTASPVRGGDGVFGLTRCAFQASGKASSEGEAKKEAMEGKVIQTLAKTVKKNQVCRPLRFCALRAVLVCLICVDGHDGGDGDGGGRDLCGKEAVRVVAKLCRLTECRLQRPD